MDAQKFGAFLAQIRKENNLTQAQLAQKIQVTDKAVSRWERGRGFPDINLLEPLARAGQVVLSPETRDAMAARDFAKEGLATLDETQKRVMNPHTYPVGLERGLYERRRDLAKRLRGID